MITRNLVHNNADLYGMNSSFTPICFRVAEV